MHSRLTADHRLRGSDRTFLGNYPVKDKDTPDRIFTSVDRQEVNTWEVVVMVVESNFNNLKCLFRLRSVSAFGFVIFSLSQFVCLCETFENNFVLFIWWFHRRWWGLSPPSAAVCTHSHTHFLSTLNPSTPVLPAVHLSSQTFLWWQSSLCSTTSVSQECHFSFYLGLYGFKGTQLPFIPSFLSLLLNSLPSLFFHLLLFIVSHSSHHYLSRQNLLKLQMCRGKKNKMGRALIPGIWDSPFRPGQNEPRSVWFGQCYSCLSKWPQVPGRFEEKSTQTRAGTGLNLTTIFESFLPSKSFWFKHTHAPNVFALGSLQGKLGKLMNGSTGNGVTQCNAKPATSE